MNKPLDFFGNEIEVGDEVAFYSDLTNWFCMGRVEEIHFYERIHGPHNNSYFKVKLDDILGGEMYCDDIIVNTEKKHREKAVEYHLSEMG